jgi:hypothetical protein
MGFPHFAKNSGDNVQRMHWCIVVQKIPGPTFLKLRPNTINLRDESLNHLLLISEHSKFDLWPNTFE